MMSLRYIFLAAMLLLNTAVFVSHAAVIELNSGKTIEAEIIHSSEKSLEVNYQGKTLYYKWNHIKSINGTPPMTLLLPASEEKQTTVIEALPSHVKAETGEGKISQPTEKNLYTQSSPAAAEQYFNQGISYAAKGNLQEAEKLFKQSLSFPEAKRNAEEALNILADFYQGTITAEHAINLFKGAQYLMKEEYRKAIDVYKEILMLHPEALEVYYNMGNAYNSMGEYEEAIPFFEKIIKRHPDDIDVWFHLGFAYYSTGQYLKAIPYLEKITDMVSDSPEVHTLLGISYQFIEQYTQAKTSLEKAKKLFIGRNDYTKAQEIEDLLKKYRLKEIEGTIDEFTFDGS